MAGFTPVYERRNVVTGLAALYLCPSVDTTTPLPAATAALGFAWASPWKTTGATTEGVSVTFAREATDIRIEEQLTPVDKKTTSAGFTVAATLAEDTLDTMRIAYGGGTIATTAAATGVPGTQKLTISTDVDYFTLGLEGQAPPRTGVTNPWRRIRVPVVTSIAEVETAYRRAEMQRVYPVSFSSLVNVDQIDIIELNAAAL